MSEIENVEFKTMDGVTLRGLVYPASKQGPGVVLSPGVSLPKLFDTLLE